MPFSNSASRLLACSVLSLLQFHAAIALGQGTSTASRIANLTTIVFDPSGAVIPNAEVTFKGEKTVAARTAQDGSVQISLPYGSYVVTINSPGFKAAKIIDFPVETDKPPLLNIVLQLSPTIGDCFPCNVQGVATITSDVPNVIEEKSTVSPNSKQVGGDLRLMPIPEDAGGFTGYPPAVYMHFFLACPTTNRVPEQRTFVSIQCRRFAVC